MEISEKSDFKGAQPIPLGTLGSFEKEDLKKGGTYFWRITGYLKKEPVSSEIAKFTVKANAELTVPYLILPNNKDNIPFTKVSEIGVNMTWKPVEGAASYVLTIEPVVKDPKVAKNTEPLVQEVKVPQYVTKNLVSGEYTWSVVAKDRKEKISKISEKRLFTIMAIPQLQWVDKKSEGVYFYVTEKPSLGAEWEKGPTSAVNWKVRYAPEGEELDKANWEKVSETKWTVGTSKEGRFEIEAEAFDQNGNPVARSQIRTVSVQQKPLLPAPQFAESVPSQIQAKKNGSVQVQWKQVEGATHYLVKVLSEKGDVIQEVKSPVNDGVVKNLMPGEYKMELTAVDTWGRRGPASDARFLKVPDQSNVVAPKLKGINVK
jgi:hypothetical protein